MLPGDGLSPGVEIHASFAFESVKQACRHAHGAVNFPVRSQRGSDVQAIQ